MTSAPIDFCSGLPTFRLPGGISGTLVGPDSEVWTFHLRFQWKVRAPESEPPRFPKMPPGLCFETPQTVVEMYLLGLVAFCGPVHQKVWQNMGVSFYAFL